MSFFGKSLVSIGVIIVLFLFVVSCEEEQVTLGEGVISGEPFVTGKEAFDVFVSNRRITAVQTNRLPLNQLGVYNDPIYGRTQATITSQLTFVGNVNADPIFGNYSADVELLGEDNQQLKDTIPENETVKEVILYMPYQLATNQNRDSDLDGVEDEFDIDPENPDSDTDGDGLTDDEERVLGSNPLDELDPDTNGDGNITEEEENALVPNTFPRRLTLDSIYGNRNAAFRFKVETSTYYLRDVDPSNNFEQAQQYFSNQDFSSFVGQTLFDGEVTIDDLEYIFFEDDDLETEDIDESENVRDRLNPGIRVELDPTFFQENVLDQEGSSGLLNQANLGEFIRGLRFSIEPINEDIMILFDLTQANIRMVYEFDDYQDEDTSDNVDGEIVKVEREYGFDLIQGSIGNAINTISNDPYSTELEMAFNNVDNAQRIYVKGGQGTYPEIRLFAEDGGDDIISRIKENNWIINEANLVFYVDSELLANSGVNDEPPRLYLFNAETNAPLYNVFTEQSSSEDPLGIFMNYGGVLEKDTSGKGVKYTFGITEYLNNIIVRDSTNVPLGLTVTSNIGIVNVAQGMIENQQDPQDNLKNIPIMATISPLGTVLFGNNVSENDIDKKLKLEIFYTEAN